MSIFKMHGREDDPAGITMRGWVPSSSERDTLEIVWNCVSTLFVCTWVILHLNVPARKDSEFIRWGRKLKWFVLALLAPELVMLCAGGQRASMSRSIKEMRDLKIEAWTPAHAFYADSGGFMLNVIGAPEFPITAKQMAYLLRYGYIDIPEITRNEIWDKSKADFFAKTIAIVQSAWFVVHIVGRVGTKLPITLLELSTVTIMSCAAATVFFWWHKPFGVEIPTVILSHTSLDKIVHDAGESAAGDWTTTPLEFIEPIGYISSHLPLNRTFAELERPFHVYRTTETVYYIPGG